MPRRPWNSWGSLITVTVLGAALAVWSASTPPTPAPGPVPASAVAAALPGVPAAIAPSTTTRSAVTTTVPPPPPVATTVAPPSPASTATGAGPEPTTKTTATHTKTTATTTTATTTTQPIPACQASQFVLAAATDATTYAPGAPVTISLTLSDTSSTACVDTGVMVWGCYGASAATSGGTVVWQSSAGPSGLPVNCPTTGYPTTIPAHFSTTAQLSWAQDECTQPVPPAQPNPDCPQVQVPSGRYEITALWTIFPSPPAVTIAIGSS